MTFPSSITKLAGKHVLQMQKNSPKFVFAGGVVGMVGSTVLACRSTLKLEEVLHEAQRDLDIAKTIEHQDYSDQDRQKDTAIIYARSVVAVGKLYAPAVILGSASVAMLTKSHNILQERNAALSAAYIALDKGFREYRARVVEKYGSDQDDQFRYDSETVVESEKGKKPKTHQRVGANGASIYARFFDELSQEWSRDPENNLIFLRCQQEYANHRLHAKGHLFLNEIYDALGLPRSEAGQIVGWLSRGEGDGYIDFGIFNGRTDEKIRDFVNGREGAVLLDFNVDGPIYNLLDTPEAQR